jgi:hypothetical protein
MYLVFSDVATLQATLRACGRSPSPEVASYRLQSTQGEERLNNYEVCQREKNKPPFIVVFVWLHVKW